MNVSYYMEQIEHFWQLYLEGCAAGTCQPIHLVAVQLYYQVVQLICTLFGCWL